MSGISWARRFATGLSSLRDRAANLRRRLAALRFNPSRKLGFDDNFGRDYEAMLARILEDVKPPK